MAFTIFVENDLVRVIRYRAYELHGIDSATSATLVEMIRSQMEYLERDIPALVPSIQSDLDTLDSLDATLTTEQGSANSTLIKADVLEWSDTRDRMSGIKERFDAVRLRIAAGLSQSIASGGGNSWTGSLLRS